MIHSICVYCGSSPGARPEYRTLARDLGRLLAERQIRLIYGGGKVGLMGTVADAALAGGGRVVGVMPAHLIEKEIAHRGLSELHSAGTMHERKALMAEMADAFVALPGGLGTLDEFFEAVTWSQLGLHAKPCGLLGVHGYFDPLLRFLDDAVSERFIRPEHRAAILSDDDPDRLLNRLADYRPVHIEKWIDREG
jgi:uncharacterized protein (TIGR00730 family)